MLLIKKSYSSAREAGILVLGFVSTIGIHGIDGICPWKIAAVSHSWRPDFHDLRLSANSAGDAKWK